MWILTFALALAGAFGSPHHGRPLHRGGVVTFEEPAVPVPVVRR
jgi:hypothetical protein